MRIALDHEALLLRTDRVATELTPRDEELLLGREAVDRARRRLLLRLAECAEGEVGAAEVADAFAKHELAVVVNAGLYEIALVLIDDALAARGECFEVVGGPPVLEATLGVELSA